MDRGRTLKLIPGDTRCLARSLVLTRLLARRGIPAKLVIGAQPAPDFRAHAWVECEGEPVLSPGAVRQLGRLVEALAVEATLGSKLPWAGRRRKSVPQVLDRYSVMPESRLARGSMEAPVTQRARSTPAPRSH